MKLNLILLAVIILLAGVLLIQMRKVREGDNARQLLSQKDQQIEQLKDKARVKTDQVLPGNLKAYLGEEEYKKLAKEIGGNLERRFQSMLAVGFQSKGTVTNNSFTYIVDSISHDTLQIRNYSDKWLSLSCSDSSCSYTYQDSVRVLVYLDRFRLFKPKTWRLKNRQSYTEVKFSNPTSKATSIRSLIKVR